MKFIKTRIEKLRNQFEKAKIEALIVSLEENRNYLSGFNAEDNGINETAGFLFISYDKLLLATDPRFTIQAEKEAPSYKILTFQNGVLKNIKEILKLLNVKKVGFEALRFSVAQYEAIKKEIDASDIELIKTYNLVEDIRAIKDEEEIENIKRACNKTKVAFEKLKKKIVHNKSEKEIAWELEKIIKQDGDTTSFSSIVAFGENSALPHHTPSNKRIDKDNIPLLFDFGVKFNGYCADMTRTIIKKKDEKFSKIYDIVFTAQQKAIDAVKEGMKASEIDKVARDYIAEKGFGDNFLHSLGHGVGLVVHEKPSISRLNDTILKENMVITIEPGIYIKGWGGIRIEDIVVVKKNGAEIL